MPDDILKVAIPLNSESQVSEVTKMLKSYGLTERQAKTYVLLLLKGPMKLSDIAYFIGTHRMQAYRVCKGLIEFGIVETSLERPTTFLALPPGESLDLLLEKMAYNFQMANENNKFIKETLFSLPKQNRAEVETSRYKIVQGRKHTFEVCQRAIKKAKFETNIIIPVNGAIRAISSGLYDIYNACAKKGVKFRWLLTDYPHNINIRQLFNSGDVRYLNIPGSIRCITIDGLATIIGSIYDDSTSLTSMGDISIQIGRAHV